MCPELLRFSYAPPGVALALRVKVISVLRIGSIDPWNGAYRAEEMETNEVD